VVGLCCGLVAIIVTSHWISATFGGSDSSIPRDADMSRGRELR
jgi:hypothetical protein